MLWLDSTVPCTCMLYGAYKYVLDMQYLVLIASNGPLHSLNAMSMSPENGTSPEREVGGVLSCLSWSTHLFLGQHWGCFQEGSGQSPGDRTIWWWRICCAGAPSLRRVTWLNRVRRCCGTAWYDNIAISYAFFKWWLVINVSVIDKQLFVLYWWFVMIHVCQTTSKCWVKWVTLCYFTKLDWNPTN